MENPICIPQNTSAVRPPNATARPVRRLPRSAGFTLIELMTVIGLMATMAMLAAPSLRDFLIRNRSAAMSNEFVATMLRARSEAVARNSCVTVCSSTLAESPPQCNGGTNWQAGWVAFANPTCNAATDAPVADDIFVRAGPFDAAYTLSSNGTNAEKLMFSASGNARPGDAGRFDLQYLSETRSSNRGICVSALGRTRLVAMGGTC